MFPLAADRTVPLVFGGHSVTIGALSDYSSPGSSRKKDVVKPEIVAPGMMFLSSLARLSDGRPGLMGQTRPGQKIPYVNFTGYYLRWQGTSAAAPYAAGVVALMMEKNHNLTIGQVRDLFRKSATHDVYTGRQIPNLEWGYGKLDLDAVKAILAAM